MTEMQLKSELADAYVEKALAYVETGKLRKELGNAIIAKIAAEEKLKKFDLPWTTEIPKKEGGYYKATFIDMYDGNEWDVHRILVFPHADEYWEFGSEESTSLKLSNFKNTMFSGPYPTKEPPKDLL